MDGEDGADGEIGWQKEQVKLAIQKCPIWNVDCEVSNPYGTPDIYLVRGSDRAGGDYEIIADAVSEIDGTTGVDEKARITSLLVEQWIRGVDVPRLTVSDIQHARGRPRLPMLDRAERILRLLVSHSTYLGEILDFIVPNDGRALALGSDISGLDTSHFEHALAWSESINVEELGHITNYLAQRGLIQKGETISDSQGYERWRTDGLYSCVVEVEGYSLIEQSVTNPDSSQCFVAMWFDNSMDAVYETGIRPAIQAAGYSPLRIDRQEFLGKIDDEIIGQIRRSRFLVADATHGEDGARGGVYYEAGFAHGMGLPVIFTCRNDMIDKVHFDTRQFNHIVWENPDDLREQLANRIGSILGDGPNVER